MARDSGFKIALAQEIEKHVWTVIMAGHFEPVVHRKFPFSAAEQVHELIESSKHIGKIILINEQLASA